METRHHPHAHPQKFLPKAAFYALGFVSILWLLIRSGPKPSRLAYPCQRAAAAYALNFLASFSVVLGLTALTRPLRHFPAREISANHAWTMRLRFLKLGLIACFFMLMPISGSSAEDNPAVLAGLSSPAAQRTVGLPGLPDPRPTVALTHLDHTPNDAEITQMVEQSIHAALGPGGLGNLVKVGDTVLVKPNLGCGYYAWESTDWRVVKPIVAQAKQAGASQVVIGEGEGCNFGDAIFDISGYKTNIPDAIYINFNDTASNPYDEVSVTGGLWTGAVAIPAAYFDADVVISVPKLKTHSEGGVTLSLKNAFGVPPVSVYNLPGVSYRTQLHEEKYEIRRSIVQINLAKTPDFTVIDGIFAGEGEGPWAATEIEMDTVIASQDLVAADAVGTAIMGIDPARIPYLAYAHEKNLGVLDLKSIHVVGATIGSVEKKFAVPAAGPDIYRKALITHRTAAPILIDGSLEDWIGADRLRLDQSSDVVSGANEWGGPQDLSLETRFLYDQVALYAIVAVRDDQRIGSAAPGQTPPVGDTLELAISVSNPWFRASNPGYGDSDFRFRVGYGPNPVVWDLNRGKTVQAAVVKIMDTANGYNVEIKIPFAELNQYAPAENNQIGLDISVLDVDNGSGLKEMAWNSPISARSADVRRLGASLLGSPRGCGDPHMPCLYLPSIHADH